MKAFFARKSQTNQALSSVSSNKISASTRALFFRIVFRSIVAALFIVALAALFVVPKLKTSTENIAMRWGNIPLVFGIGLVMSFLYQSFMRNRSLHSLVGEKWIHNSLHSKTFKVVMVAVSAALLMLPFIVSVYHIKILTLVFIYVIFSLGLNVVVGLAGMLCLGQAFFLGVGAYTYALLNVRAGVSFYVGLPAGAMLGAIAGVFFALLTLRLRGDYLAIVTLGLSEIFRLIMTNVNFTGGPRGISGIEKPGFFGLNLDYFSQSRLLYFVSFALVLLSIVLVRRLEHSRFGRAWEALREDEIASAAMGINIASVRIGVFAINGVLGGLAGVLFASNASFIDPGSFSISVSITALCVVVLGGLGSISGIVLGTLVLIMLPEYLRFFSQYRMLVFGAILVFMMLFRPEGIVPKSRTEFMIEKEKEDKNAAS